MNLRFAFSEKTVLPKIDKVSSEPAKGLTEWDEEKQALLDQLKQEARPFKQLPGRLTIVGVSFFGGATAYLTTLLLFSSQSLAGALLPFLLLVGALAGALHYAYRVVPRRLKKNGRRKAFLKIEETGDVRFIAPMLDLWIGGKNANYSLLYELASSLTVLLPHLNADNAEALPTKQKKLLHRVMAMTPISFSAFQEKLYGDLFADCIVEIVKALARLGDTSALPSLRNLAKLKGSTPWHQQVRTAAGESLLTLELLALEETSAKTLLRASTQQDRTGETLLRSVETRPDSAPQTLLRPAAEQEAGAGFEP